ncbi:melanoma-associated antigen 10-like [Physeter macrocephalus]|uniref:Melanoma-associated antigen 10-like n=1 Tax=Physeter macrocephalus TaxID=9755 RepID=A0A2Y9EJH7_PHYMC|nr:melanoma-associated antigen 10-like [Physeter catodon]|eukprot:XP_007103276.2 melanoma-associated antigen 10-like [Physeter catodon]
MGGSLASAASSARTQGAGVSRGGSQGGEGLGVSEKTGQLKESHQVRRRKSPRLYQSQGKDPWNVTSRLRLAEAQEERAQALLEERPVGSHLPPSCLRFYLLPPTRVIMPHSPKHPRLTFEPGFQTLSNIQGLLMVQVPTAEEEEETASVSSCSFTFSYPSTSPPSSPLLLGTPEEEQGEEEQGEEEQGEEQGQQGEEQGGEEQGQQGPAAVTRGPPQSPQSSSSTSWSTSDGSSSIQAEEGTCSPQALVGTTSSLRDLLDEKVADLLRFMVLKYRLKEPFTKAEMLKVVIKNQFPVIFKKASKYLEVISGLDVKEVDPKIHSYVLVSSLDLTHDDMHSDDQSMPKNGLLVIILGVIFIEGNCAPEENIWDFLNMIGVYAGRKHFIYGEPRKLITRDWVQENYLEYRRVPNSHPLRYEFLWGPRAHAETSKLKVLEFLAKIKGTDPISFSYWYEEALRDDKESQGHSWPLG